MCQRKGISSNCFASLGYPDFIVNANNMNILGFCSMERKHDRTFYTFKTSHSVDPITLFSSEMSINGYLVSTFGCEMLGRELQVLFAAAAFYGLHWPSFSPSLYLYVSESASPSLGLPCIFFFFFAARFIFQYFHASQTKKKDTHIHIFFGAVWRWNSWMGNAQPTLCQ